MYLSYVIDLGLVKDMTTGCDARVRWWTVRSDTKAIPGGALIGDHYWDEGLEKSLGVFNKCPSHLVEGLSKLAAYVRENEAYQRQASMDEIMGRPTYSTQPYPFLVGIKGWPDTGIVARGPEIFLFTEDLEDVAEWLSDLYSPKANTDRRLASIMRRMAK